jgi:23S rRNA (uracil1939-C5)-methyltransferase
MCDPAASGQLLPQTIEAVESLGQRLGRAGLQHVREIELTENTAATERAVLIELQPGFGVLPHVVLPSADVPAFTGVVVLRSDVPDRSSSRGSPYVTDVLPLSGASAALTLRRHVASFFQANRYLLTSLVHAVTELVPAGRVVDLYAGAGVFGLACAALQRGPVVAVESDRHGSQDLKHNARPFADAVRVVGGAVEAFLGREPIADDATLIVDPPRTGMSREATLAITRTHARRVIYVSCDVATLARDVRRLIDAGYRLAHIEGFDLFPNTAHVETVVLLTRSE